MCVSVLWAHPGMEHIRTHSRNRKYSLLQDELTPGEHQIGALLLQEELGLRRIGCLGMVDWELGGELGEGPVRFLNLPFLPATITPSEEGLVEYPERKNVQEPENTDSPHLSLDSTAECARSLVDHHDRA